jgi:hypothetical protein
MEEIGQLLCPFSDFSMSLGSAPWVAPKIANWVTKIWVGNLRRRAFMTQLRIGQV